MDRLPALRYVLLVDLEEHPGGGPMSLPKLMQAASDVYTIPPTEPEDIALLHFSSGTSGMPKGALHAHSAALTETRPGRGVRTGLRESVIIARPCSDHLCSH